MAIIDHIFDFHLDHGLIPEHEEVFYENDYFKEMSENSRDPQGTSDRNTDGTGQGTGGPPDRDK